MRYVREESTEAGAGDLALCVSTPHRGAPAAFSVHRDHLVPHVSLFQGTARGAQWDSGTAESTVAKSPPKGIWGYPSPLLLGFPGAEREHLASVLLGFWERILALTLRAQGG